VVLIEHLLEDLGLLAAHEGGSKVVVTLGLGRAEKEASGGKVDGDVEVGLRVVSVCFSQYSTYDTTYLDTRLRLRLDLLSLGGPAGDVGTRLAFLTDRKSTVTNRDLQGRRAAARSVLRRWQSLLNVDELKGCRLLVGYRVVALLGKGIEELLKVRVGFGFRELILTYPRLDGLGLGDAVSVGVELP
jgi:hypothetical protein